MKRPILTLTALALVGLPGPAVAPAVASPGHTVARTGPTARSATVVLDGVTVHLRARTRQVVAVNHTRGYHARVSLWRLTRRGWQRLAGSTNGRIGYGGLVRARRRHQWTGTTPLGTFGLISSFGTHRRAERWNLAYRRIRTGDYWVEDNASAYYNRYRNKRQGGFRWWLSPSVHNSSERLKDFPRQYEYALVTSFNRAQVRRRGAGIFLHVNGSGATAGCVSGPRPFISKAMARLDPRYAPVIAIGR